jgi:hypothetical protein
MAPTIITPMIATILQNIHAAKRAPRIIGFEGAAGFRRDSKRDNFSAMQIS